MNNKIRKVSFLGMVAIVLTSCSGQTSRCCNNNQDHACAKEKISSSKKNNDMNSSTLTCQKCGKNACDQSCTSSTSNSTTFKSLVPSCSLTELQMLNRKKELTDANSIFSKVKEVIELHDGYDFVFNEPKEFSMRLLEFINFERHCCSNFSYALEFEPNEKATHLKIYGSEAIKIELKTGFTVLGVIKNE